MFDLLELRNHLALLTLIASMLAILNLRIVTGSTSQQIKLIREFHTSAETACRTAYMHGMLRSIGSCSVWNKAN